jgi:hypothetical protein
MLFFISRGPKRFRSFSRDLVHNRNCPSVLRLTWPRQHAAAFSLRREQLVPDLAGVGPNAILEEGDRISAKFEEAARDFQITAVEYRALSTKIDFEILRLDAETRQLQEQTRQLQAQTRQLEARTSNIRNQLQLQQNMVESLYPWLGLGGSAQGLRLGWQ